MDALLETLKKLGPARLALMAATFVALIGFFAFIAVRSGSPSMTLLYGDLSTSDSTQIAGKLDVSDIPYQMVEGGTQVMVNSQDVGRARMLLAEEGLPSSGSLGYEIFDRQQSFGTTSFVQNINQLRALEGELARTISTLSPIRTARVHLVMPERELFSRESRPATASVFVNVRNSAEVGPEQIAAIQHMVASAVPQLQPGRVAIIDGGGNLLARGDDSDRTSFAATSAEDMKMKYEQRLARSIEDLVARVVGQGRVRAIVSADLDFSTVSRNSEIYDPEGQVVRSTQTITEEDVENTAESSGVTVQNNLPGLPGAQQDGSAPPAAASNRSEEVVNYEITRTIESVTQESGEVDQLSVAVLVDGRYEPVASTAPAEGAEEDGEVAEAALAYVPRSEQELAQIRALVRSAIGFDESRGDTLEVVNMQFAQERFTDPLPDDTILGLPRDQIVGIAETLIFSLVGVLIILLVLRPLVSHISAAAEAQAAANAAEEEAKLLAAAGGAPQLAPPTGDGEGGELEATLDMSNVEGQVKQSSVKKISELVEKHPNETVSVIRNWMTQEN